MSKKVNGKKGNRVRRRDQHHPTKVRGLTPIERSVETLLGRFKIERLVLNLTPSTVRRRPR